MALTKEMSDQLKDFFPVQAHEFLNGNTYITEEAITNRLDDVDPSWEFHKLEIHRDGIIVTATYRLIVCGVARDGVGMSSVQYGKDKDGKPTDREVNEAEKSAATDALKRCARLFGIGRYILEMGRSVSDQRTLTDWLAKRRGVNKETGEIKLVQNGTQKPQEAVLSDLQASMGEIEQSTSEAPKTDKSPSERLGTPAGQRIGSAPVVATSGTWEYDLPALMSHPDVAKTYPQYEHRANAIKKLHSAGHFESVANISEAVKLLIERPDKVTA